jgi:hypothetical protein
MPVIFMTGLMESRYKIKAFVRALDHAHEDELGNQVLSVMGHSDRWMPAGPPGSFARGEGPDDAREAPMSRGVIRDRLSSWPSACAAS